jgi:hypothetical protein
MARAEAGAAASAVVARTSASFRERLDEDMDDLLVVLRAGA